MQLSTPQCQHCINREINPFHFCNTDEISKINDHKTYSVYQRGQVIFQQGSNPIGLFCIYSGKVKIYKHGSDGKEQIVRVVKPGGFVGYRSLLAETQYSAYAAAMEDAAICLIPRREFFSLMHTNNRVSDAMMKLLCKNLQEAEEKIVDIAYTPIRGRIAEALLLLEKSYRVDNNKNVVVPITRKDLASIVGTAQESAIRLLSEFKREKLIEINGRKITIIDTKGLLSIANIYN